MSDRAISSLDSAQSGDLACCDISLWEIAMLVDQGRLDPGTDTQTFIGLALAHRSLVVLSITPEIAALSVSLGLHGDPADRLIAATTIRNGANLVTADRKLRDSAVVPTLW